ncbi:MFS transporter [Idiomarina sp. HP20-50]|uniref:MFS transporter n=1 Tax=Idiomarina sp. HP20-50 TaxID=3070813 RepID=UPI00294B7110|nr:MFS transporter [Idiomarina sp. HP20-50]MDV6315910.1 MFS transporter [Idiomarina sp. HP20-50]
MTQQKLNKTERKAALALASVFGIRMLGLFLIMPVLAVYAQDYPDYSPLWVGIALGAYGLSQALLQIPLGMLSDRIGRKPVIVMGLLVFVAGSVVAAQADTLFGVSIGRALQGLGAIAAAILALAADLSRDEQRPKVMATIGMCIGLAFAVSLVAGPLLGDIIGLSGLFWFTAGSGILGILVLLLSVPKVVTTSARRESLPVLSELGHLLKHKQLWCLNSGIFVLHAILTAWFVTLPMQLQNAGFESQSHAWFYLPTLVASIALMVPMIIHSSRNNNSVQWLRVSILTLIASLLIIGLAGQSAWLLVVALVIFFTGFNFIEATLPSLLTRVAPAGSKGSASGIYSTGQFLGSFVGGVAGGGVLQNFGLSGVVVFCLILLLCWLIISFFMVNPAGVTSVSLSLPGLSEGKAIELSERLLTVAGVKEARWVEEDQATYLKVDKKNYDEKAVNQLLEKASVA